MTTPPPFAEAYWILGGLFAAVSIATLIAFLLERRRPADAMIRNLKQRIHSWWAIIAVGGGALLAGRAAILLLFTLVSALALREFLKNTVSPADRVLPGCCLLLLAGQYTWIATGRFDLFCIWIPVASFTAISVAAAIFTPSQGFIARAGAAMLGLAITVYGISHVPALMLLRIPGYADGGRDRVPLLIAFVVIVAEASDILQYVWGKLAGRHLLIPQLSPSKTIEGLIGGIASATLLGALLYRITPFRMWEAGAMAFLIASFGFAGGLLMSAIKRDRGIKDWGRLIPGHGGMLDRVDSLCLSAPVFFYLTRHFFAQ